tara:strand:- start:1224 stop:1355 length:132 start_codon:yes stop_codon:yes gene_type:complete
MKKDIKSFIIGFLMATMIFVIMAAGTHPLGSVPQKPLYVKIVK